MAHFRGTLQGARGQVSRLGHKSTGITAVLQSWNGAVRVELVHGDDGHDYCVVRQEPHHGAGVHDSVVSFKVGEPTG